MYSLDRQKRHIWLLSRIFLAPQPDFPASQCRKMAPQPDFLAPQPNFFWLLSWIFCFGSSAEFFILAPQPNFFFLLPYQILRLIVLKTPPLDCSYSLKTTMNFNLTVHTALWG